MRAELPAGTVTFLFTDVEGSTKLLHELGAEAYAAALAEHRRIVRAACVAEGGVEVDTQGDAFFLAFSSPGEAVGAAQAITDGLSSGPITLRIGLHTGAPLVTDEGYVGDDVHLAARVAASGHGGQILLSKATRELVGGLSIIDLGEHRLKDIEEPVSIYQLGSRPFPPLKTISSTNLPSPASSFIGRQRERDEIVSMLSNGARLLTLTGPGGSGKTRLAIEAAAELVPEFKAGVFWVGLSALREPALVSEEIAQTLGAKKNLAEHIGEREMLLLLDNFEQVVEAAPGLSQLLERCPRLKILVTSRALLRVLGEVEYAVPRLAESEAVQLFCTRAQLEPDGTIDMLCRRLDDLPLALELAAARTRALSPAQILERLSQRLDLLEGGRDVDPRQQTLRATIAWSHELLDYRERELFARLAVFRGGWTLDAADEVAAAGLDTLQSLVEKNLVRHTDERFWLLETIHEYAAERLTASPELAELRRRHALFFLAFAEAADACMVGGEQAMALARVDAEHDNLRAALEWARDSREPELLLRLVAALGGYWENGGFSHDIGVWLPLALDCGSSPAGARMSLLWEAWTQASFYKRDRARSAALISEWRSLAEREGDERHVLLTMNAEAVEMMNAGELEEASRTWKATADRAREVGDRFMVAVAVGNQGDVAYRTGDYHTSLEHWAEGAELHREQSNDGNLATFLTSCGWASLCLFNPDRAGDYFRESLAIVGRLGAIRSRKSVIALSGLGAARIAKQEAERGVALLGAAASLGHELDGDFFEEHEQEILDVAAAASKAAIGEAGFAAAWARGQAMTQDEILTFALAG